MAASVAVSLMALGLHTPGCARPSRFTVDKASWRAARTARRALPVDTHGKTQRYLRPEYVLNAYGYDEDEIAVPDPGLPYRRWGVGSLWTGVGLAGLSLLPFATAGYAGFGSLSADTREERREIAAGKSRGDIAGWTLLGTGVLLFFGGGILLAVGHGKADEVLLPVGVDPFDSELNGILRSLEPRAPEDTRGNRDRNLAP